MKKRLKVLIITSSLVVFAIIGYFIYMPIAKAQNDLEKLGYTKQQAQQMVDLSNTNTIVSKSLDTLQKELTTQQSRAAKQIGTELKVDIAKPLKQQVDEAVLYNDTQQAYFESMISFLQKHVSDYQIDSSKTLLQTVNEMKSIYTNAIQPEVLNFVYKQEPTVSQSVDYNNAYGILIVNKTHPLSPDYSPGENPLAVAQLKQLIGDMQNQGLDVSSSYSGFRSYNTQKTLYENYVSQYGQASADTFSARPGYSEHQTGLAFDLINQSGQLLGMDNTNAAEIAWLEAYAANYGFIIRYPQGKDSITGYTYEPWHLRYVGDVAKEIVASGLTLEAFLNVSGGDYQ